MLIGCFVIQNPDQVYFDNIYNPKYCIKKIKEIDSYIYYIAYSEYSTITTKKHESITLMKSLLTKFPNRIEAYLKTWQILIKGNSSQLSELEAISDKIFNSAYLHLDDSNLK